MNDRLHSSQLLTMLLVALWAVGVSLQLGWIEPLRHAWAFNLWQYLPPVLSGALAIASLSLCLPPVRHRLAVALADSGEGGARLRVGVALVLVLAALWTLRERRLFGDSEILVWDAGRGLWFTLPEPGATFLLGRLVKWSHELGWTDPSALVPLQLAICLAGVVTVYSVIRSARWLAPGRATGVVLLILSGGIPRIFAGHLEVYAFLMVAVAAYLWKSLDHLGGRGSLAAPATLLGVAVWLHLGALCLVPSLLLLPVLRGERGRTALQSAAFAALLAALPSAAFLAVFLALGAEAELRHAVARVHEILGVEGGPQVIGRWVRGWASGPSRGTDYVLLSLPHLKYLANAAHLLCPAALPTLAVCLARRPRVLTATRVARFLAAACFPLLLYTIMLRPIWGPFDWDLFTVTAFFFGALAAHGLAGLAAEARAPHVVHELHAWLVGVSLLFVCVPFLLMARLPLREAGPFTGHGFDFELIRPEAPSGTPLEPWL
jgi:hypothetical protein